ncbi:hypothetical protein ACFQ67_31950 [Streptomyces sp. NPDC056488]|uniref:hypothetical protein n=1 Tax=unclassified Streptomyces TaxID=2593676 RepID=UPI0036AB6B64
MAAPVAAGAVAEPITHRNWTDEWVTVRCGACGREGDWPHPELGCQCGAVLRVPVRTADSVRPADAVRPAGEAGDRSGGTGDPGGRPGVVPPRTAGPGPNPPGPDGAAPGGTGPGGTGPSGTSSGRTGPSGTGLGGTSSGRTGPGSPAGADRPGSGTPDRTDHDTPADPREPGTPPRRRPPHRTFAERYPAHIPLPPTAPHPAPVRGAFRPVTIRTGRDAVAAAAAYLRWLGFRDVVQPEERPASGVDLRAPGLVAQVDPSTRPTGLRVVECLWLNGLSTSAVSVFFSLAGYTQEARARAAEIGLPLFVLDLTGTPQPVNRAADDLAAHGA